MAPKQPTKESVIARIKEYERIGRIKFLEKYAHGHRAISWYILYKDNLYDVKPIWAAAHEPAVMPMSFHTSTPRSLLPQMGFTLMLMASKEAKEFREGKEEVKEVNYFHRNKKLVKAAKERYGFKCIICCFEFQKIYGAIGEKYIECHHLYPLAKNEERRSTIDDVRMVCSNCHRMIHIGGKLRSIEEMKKLVEANKELPSS